MITMEMLGKIRRMHLRDKMSLHAIAKQTGLSRNTLRRWLREPDEAAVPTYQRTPGTGKLSAFYVTLELALKADAQRNKQNRRTAKALFAQSKADGYTGCYSRVTDFIREWRVSEGKTPHAFVPLTFELGEAFQFDWSDEGLVVGGNYYKLQVSHLKLCASRAFWLVAYPSQGHEMLFDAHTRSFAALGGVARRGIYDNMKTAVDLGLEGQGSCGQCALCGDVRALACLMPTSATSPRAGRRGWWRRTCKTAAGVSGWTRRRFSGAPSLKLNAWLGERCRALWSELRHPEFREFSVLQMLVAKSAPS